MVRLMEACCALEEDSVVVRVAAVRMRVDRVVPAGSTEGSWLGSRNVSNFFTGNFFVASVDLQVDCSIGRF